MRGDDEQSGHLFSYVSPEQRVPTDHPLRAIRRMTDAALRELRPALDGLYSRAGRPSVQVGHLKLGQGTLVINPLHLNDERTQTLLRRLQETVV